MRTGSQEITGQLNNTINSKGVLLPRLTSVQETNMISPAIGMLIYNLTLESFRYYDGTKWNNLFDRDNFINIGPKLNYVDRANLRIGFLCDFKFQIEIYKYTLYQRGPHVRRNDGKVYPDRIGKRYKPYATLKKNFDYWELPTRLFSNAPRYFRFGYVDYLAPGVKYRYMPLDYTVKTYLGTVGGLTLPCFKII